MLVSASMNDPGSTISRMRSSVGMTKWCPHRGQHHSALCTRADSTVWPHSSHFWNSPEGTERFCGAASFFFAFSRDHQAISASASEPLTHLQELEELPEPAHL